MDELSEILVRAAERFGEGRLSESEWIACLKRQFLVLSSQISHMSMSGEIESREEVEARARNQLGERG